jgi:hypothetical protein
MFGGIKMGDLINKAKQAFLKARDAIDRANHPYAFNKSYSMPLRFYLERSTKEAVSILYKMEEENNA